MKDDIRRTAITVLQAGAAGDRDPYSILLLPPGRHTLSEARAAYKQLLYLHPDKNPGIPEAAEAFKLVVTAFDSIRHAETISTEHKQQDAWESTFQGKWSAFTGSSPELKPDSVLDGREKEGSDGQRRPFAVKSTSVWRAATEAVLSSISAIPSIVDRDRGNIVSKKVHFSKDGVDMSSIDRVDPGTVSAKKRKRPMPQARTLQTIYGHGMPFEGLAACSSDRDERTTKTLERNDVRCNGDRKWQQRRLTATAKPAGSGMFGFKGALSGSSTQDVKEACPIPYDAEETDLSIIDEQANDRAEGFSDDVSVEPTDGEGNTRTTNRGCRTPLLYPKERTKRTEETVDFLKFISQARDSVTSPKSAYALEDEKQSHWTDQSNLAGDRLQEVIKSNNEQQRAFLRSQIAGKLKNRRQRMASRKRRHHRSSQRKLKPSLFLSQH